MPKCNKVVHVLFSFFLYTQFILCLIQEKVQSGARLYGNMTQTELMIRRVHFIRRTKEAATQVVCAGNAREYHLEYGNSWFNNRENDVPKNRPFGLWVMVMVMGKLTIFGTN